MQSKYIVEFHYSSQVKQFLSIPIPTSAEVNADKSKVGFDKEQDAREFIKLIRQKYLGDDIKVGVNLINSYINKTILTIYNK